MPDLFSQFGQPPQANPYMWPPLQGNWGWGKQGLMGAAGAGDLPPPAQGQGTPGGPQFSPPTPPAMPPPDFSQLQNTPQPPDAGAPQQPPQPPSPPPPDAGAPPAAMSELQAGLSGTPQNPTISGQAQGPMPGVPGGMIGAQATVSPADYSSMIKQAQMFGKIPFAMQQQR